MHDWNVVKLASLAANHPAAFATGPFGSAVSAKNFKESGVPMIRGSNLSEDIGVRLRNSDFVFVSEELAEQFSRSIAKPGDLVFTCWGSIGQLGLVEDGGLFDRLLVSNKQMKMTPDQHRVLPLYLYYYLSQPKMVSFVKSQSIGSSVPGFNLGQLRELPVALPELSVQQAITETLGALDDRIVANERLILLLDEWVRSSFATMTGPPHLLGNFASNIRSQAQPSDVEPSTLYYGLEHLPRRCMWAFGAGAASEVASVKSMFYEHDILFGKLRPYFHKVISAPSKGVCSTDILVVRPRDPELAGFVLAACASDEIVRACTAASEGTRMPRIRWKDLEGLLITWPGESVARAFSAQVSLKSNLAHGLIRESHQLARIRDELLPLLMSGKVRVREAERVVEEVL